MSRAVRPFLTVFGTPKAFEGAIDTQQRNAIQSWQRLGPDVDVLLVGDDPGTAEVAHELGVRHIASVEKSAHGTPLISSIFRQANDSVESPLVCYVNADIILMSDFMRAVKQIGTTRFLMCGQRWDVDFAEAIDFSSEVWQQRLRSHVVQTGVLHGVTGMDYFVFPRGLFATMPDFAIGRPVWDNWLVFHARVRGVCVVDATRAVLAVHQNHSYQHVAGGISSYLRGPEAQSNRALAVEMLYPFTISDATRRLTNGRLSGPRSLAQVVRLLQGLIAVKLRRHAGARALVRRVARAAPIADPIA